MSFTKQSGVSLAVALVMLLVISIIGMSSIRVATMDEKMTSNMADKEISFQASESSLIQAESWLMGLSNEPIIRATTCTDFPCVRKLDNDLAFGSNSHNWWLSNAGAYNNATLNYVNLPPRYYLEHFRFVPDNPTIGNGVPSGFHYYRVTSRALAGSSNSAVSILQTSLARRY